MTFKERTKLGFKQASNQKLITLEEARKQVEWLKNNNNNIKKK